MNPPATEVLERGALVVFNGDYRQHRITPLDAGGQRVSLTLQYVTNPWMARYRRFASNRKDAIAYFDFREVFRRGGTA